MPLTHRQIRALKDKQEHRRRLDRARDERRISREQRKLWKSLGLK